MKVKNTGRPGLVILGVGPACGKTVVLTGLACSLQEEGFPASAMKPICLGDKNLSKSELTFISSISHTPLTYPVQYLDKPGHLSNFAWAEAIRIVTSVRQTTLVELPGSTATPIMQANSTWKDTADFALELSWPCLLVASTTEDLIEKLLFNTVYLLSRGLPVIGLVTVETTIQNNFYASTGLTVDTLALALFERTRVPLIGCLPYSPSISVPAVNQGNLIKTTSCTLDLLPVIEALNLSLSV
ncbi:MAG: AAA family ATPase [Candidatus Melainabacteria bacterium]|nr:AAA family ATPase [Candidatus Melainabacteria bacterium]